MSAHAPLEMKPAVAPVQTPTPAPFGTLQRKCACGGSGSSGGDCEGCKKKKTLQRRATDSARTGFAPPIVDDVVHSSGQPLDAETRAFFEPRFGHDFSNVRIHADARAAESSRSVNAAAYTVGSNIVFGSGRYSPGTQAGRHLLAHELTHVVQQTPVLSRQPAVPAAQSGPAQGGAAQSNAGNHLVNLADVIERYAQRAGTRVGDTQGADANAVRRNIATARKGAGALRQVAAQGNDRLSAVVLGKFSEARLKAASSGLVPANIQPAVAAISQSAPPSLAAKSLEISHPQDAAEIEADRVASSVMSGRTASPTVTPSGLGVYRELSSEAEEAFEEEEVSAIREVVKDGAEELAEEEIAEGAATTFLGMGPVGWGILAAVVVVVVVVAVLYYYYSKDDGAKQPSPQPQPAPAPQPAPGPDKDKKKPKPPFVLRLPQQKKPHLERYRSWLGALQSDPFFDRGDPPQLERWHQALRLGGSDAIPAEVYERGHTLGFTGESGERLIRVPNWSRNAANIQMQVDHIIELQVTPPAMREEFNSIFNMELLDAQSNQESGNLLKINILAERAKQAAVDPTTAAQVLIFDAVELDGGTDGTRWSSEELRAGEQLDAHESAGGKK